MPAVSGFPIHIHADDQFSRQERESLSVAIQEWNAVGQSLIHSDLFTVEYRPLSASLRILNPHDCSQELGGERDFSIVREQNQSHWASIGFDGNTPGVTIRCYDGDSLARQIVYINPTPLRLSVNQLDQAFAHELGHALGLDHSCNAQGGSADFIGCNSVNSKSHPDYFNAVMYPELKSSSFYLFGRAVNASYRGFSILQQNDKDRAKCVVN